MKYELALFAGAGGGILGGMLCGFTCVGAVEIEEYPRKVLLARQRDGILPKFPIWNDVRTFRADNPECSEYITWLRSIRKELIITGGFPCQDISTAGRGAGINGEKSRLWKEYASIICEIRPARVFVENSPALTIRGLNTVLGDLASMGYNAKWGVLGAADVGACHLRERIWIMAYPNSKRQQQPERTVKDKRRWSGNKGKDVPHSGKQRGKARIAGEAKRKEWKSAKPINCGKTQISNPCEQYEH